MVTNNFLHLKCYINFGKYFYLLILFISPLVYAQDSLQNKSAVWGLEIKDLPKEMKEQEMTITSVSKEAEKLSEAPQTVIVLTEEEIRKRGYLDLEQLFHDLPGFSISRGNGPEYSQIYMRGYRSNNTDRMLLLIDGVEENDLWSYSAWISRQYPLSRIKRVEIVYGPASTIYGANAFLGAVNIITKDAKDIVKANNSIGISAQANYGSMNTKFAEMTVAARFLRNVNLSVSGRIYQSDEVDLSKYKDWNYDLNDYDIEYYKNMIGTQNDEVAKIARRLDSMVYYHDPVLGGKKPRYKDFTDNRYLAAKLQTEGFTLGYQIYSIDEGYGGWYRDDFELGTDYNIGWGPRKSMVYARYEKTLTDKIGILSQITFQEHQLPGDINQELYYSGYMNGSYKASGIVDSLGVIKPESEWTMPIYYHAWYHTYSNQMRSEFRVTYAPSTRFNMIAGVDYRRGHTQGQYIVSVDIDRPEENASPVNILGGNHFFSRDIGFFAQGNYRILDNLKAVVGGRIDNNRIRSTGGYGTVFNPKLALVYFSEKTVLKVIYSGAFQNVDNWTKFSLAPDRQLNNPTLGPEKVRNLEISGTWNIFDYLSTDITYFRASYSDIVGTARVKYIDENGEEKETSQHQGVGTILIQGLQGNVNYKKGNYSAYLNYTFNHPYNTEQNKETRVGDIPDFSFNIGGNASFLKNKLNIHLRMNYVGEKPTGKNTTISKNPNDKIPAYTIFSGAVTYQLIKGLALQLYVNNILNKEYFHPGVRSAEGSYNAAIIPQNERNFMTKLLVDF